MTPEMQRFPVVGTSALKLDYPLLQVQVIDINSYRDSKKEVQAFNHEFYEKASNQQIEEDIVSYLGEYRFEVPEFDYRLNITEDRLIDPASGESMVQKAAKAILERKKQGKNFSREEAEHEGLIKLEQQLAANPTGTVVWFSPPGPKEEGYGEYGFGYRGKRQGNVLEMTAIRLENPSIDDFNQASEALWGIKDYKKAEDFLRAPQVVDIDSNEVKDFIQGFFEIGDKRKKDIFEKVKVKLKDVIKDYVTEKDKHKALHVIENMSLELKARYEEEDSEGNVIFLTDYRTYTLAEAMVNPRYTAPPPLVRGSCGLAGKNESNDVFRSINKSGMPKERDFKFDQPGPCRLCGEHVSCGPCKICELCNDKIDSSEQAA